MFLSTKPARYTTAAKARLNTRSHKLDNIEARKRSPDGIPGPPSPSEVIVFNNTNHGNGNNRGFHASRNLPEVPQIEEIQKYLRDMWDRKMLEIKTQNLKVHWIKSDKDIKRDGGFVSVGSHSTKQKNSPLHSNRK